MWRARTNAMIRLPRRGHRVIRSLSRGELDQTSHRAKIFQRNDSPSTHGSARYIDGENEMGRLKLCCASASGSRAAQGRAPCECDRYHGPHITPSSWTSRPDPSGRSQVTALWNTFFSPLSKTYQVDECSGRQAAGLESDAFTLAWQLSQRTMDERFILANLNLPVFRTSTRIPSAHKFRRASRLVPIFSQVRRGGHTPKLL